jgi:hypothetical protein
MSWSSRRRGDLHAFERLGAELSTKVREVVVMSPTAFGENVKTWSLVSTKGIPGTDCIVQTFREEPVLDEADELAWVEKERLPVVEGVRWMYMPIVVVGPSRQVFDIGSQLARKHGVPLEEEDYTSGAPCVVLQGQFVPFRTDTVPSDLGRRVFSAEATGSAGVASESPMARSRAPPSEAHSRKRKRRRRVGTRSRSSKGHQSAI